MSIPALLALSLLLLLCAPPSSTEVRAQFLGTGNPAMDLVDHYGNVAHYFILVFYRYFNTEPMYLEAYLQQLKRDGWLSVYCKYLQDPNRTCVVKRPGATAHATIIISYLNTECCSVASRSCGPVKVVPTQRILPGVNTTQGEFPWVAQLLFSGEANCACVIIDEYHCITAGHCVDYNSLNSGSMMVAAGKWRRALYTDATEQIRTVVRAKRHELFEKTLLKNDIALMRVNTPFIFNEFVYPVCLPTPTDVPPAFCEVAGFGSLSFPATVLPVYMQKVSLNAYTREQCLQTFQSTTKYDISIYLHNGTMCAANGIVGGKDACRGDSGSSLMCLNAGSTRYTLFGIVSNGFGCGDVGQPGYYTHVPTYRTWIDNAIVELSTPATGK